MKTLPTRRPNPPGQTVGFPPFIAEKSADITERIQKGAVSDFVASSLHTASLVAPAVNSKHESQENPPAGSPTPHRMSPPLVTKEFPTKPPPIKRA
jgi:hypothetical protein